MSHTVTVLLQGLMNHLIAFPALLWILILLKKTIHGQRIEGSPAIVQAPLGKNIQISLIAAKLLILSAFLRL